MYPRLLTLRQARQRSEPARSKTCNDHRARWVRDIVEIPEIDGAKVFRRNIRQHNHFGAEYHADHSFEINPPSYTLLRMVKTPPNGGDTIFTSQTALFDKLSAPFQKALEGLHAAHSADVSRRSCPITKTTSREIWLTK